MLLSIFLLFAVAWLAWSNGANDNLKGAATLVGALCGAGLAMPGGSLNTGYLAKVFFLPLVLSPLAAVALTALLYPLLHHGRNFLGIGRETCVCVGEEVRVLASEGCVACASAPVGGLSLTVADEAECFQRYAGRVAGVSVEAAVDRLHYLSAAAICFARGVNDTPKIVALLIGTEALAPGWGLALVGLFMVAGGVLQARKVTNTMSYRITDMNHGQALGANLVTAFLVLLASRLGFPVSTTHVSCGSIFGLGLVRGGACRGTIAKILGAWAITLPAAALLAAAATRAVSMFP